MYCTKCGTKAEGGTSFCSECGASLNNAVFSTRTDYVSQDTGSFSRLFTGRLNRKSYFIGLLFAILPLFIFVTLWGLINILVRSLNGISFLDTTNHIINLVIPFLITISLPWLVFLGICVTIRRCHDFGSNGFLSLITVIPYLGLLAVFAFLFIKSDGGPNIYGPQIKDRKVLADIFNY